MNERFTNGRICLLHKGSRDKRSYARQPLARADERIYVTISRGTEVGRRINVTSESTLTRIIILEQPHGFTQDNWGALMNGRQSLT
jgi:hypothetical protein